MELVFAIIIAIFIIVPHNSGPLPYPDTPRDCRICSQELTAEQVRRINKSHKDMIRKAVNNELVR